MSATTEEEFPPHGAAGLHDPLFRHLVEFSCQGIGWADLEGNIVYMNPALRRMLELDADAELSGVNLRHFYRPQDLAMVEGEMLAGALQQGNWSGEMTLLTRHGGDVPTLHNVHLIRDETGAVIALAFDVTDLSQQKLYEQNLHRSKSKYRALVENIPQRVFYKDLQSRYLAANRRYAGDLGIHPKDIVGQDDYAFHPRGLADKYRRDDQRVMASGETEAFDEAYLCNGQERIIHTVKTPVRGDRGQVIGVCGIFLDVTEQRRLEQRVTESEATLRAIYENVQEGIMVASSESSRLIMANPAICRMLGYSEAELLDMPPQDLHPSEALPRVRAHFRAMEQGDFTVNQVMPLLRKDGGIRYADIGSAQISVNQRRCYMGVFRDVTEYWQAREALARSEALLAEAQALAQLGNWNLSLSNGSAIWSDEEYRLLGYPVAAQAASVENFMRVVHPDDRDAVMAEMQRVMHPGETRLYHIEHRVLRPDGEYILEQRGRVIFDDAGQPIRMYGTSQDITDQKRVAEELARHRAHLEDLVRERTAEAGRESQRNAIIVNTAMDGFFTAGQDGCLLDCNEHYCRMLGYRRDEMLALHIRDIVADESPAQTAAHLRAIQDRGQDRFDTRHRRKDGSLVDVEVNVILARIGDEPQLFCFVHDISERKVAEAATMRARDEAERANRAKSEFLSRMSHELRTPLNAILGFGQLLQHARLDEQEADNVEEILHAGQHLLELINEVLDLARIESGKFAISLEPVSLPSLIADCLGLMRPQAEARGIRIVDASADSHDTCAVHVRADRARLRQVLLNLLSNSIKYNADQGVLRVDCRPHGDAIQIRVSDSGAGLSAEQQARLFVPFERLGADQIGIEGTGIGLALSKRLVDLMQGEIGVESAPGAGSTFWVGLPCARAPAEAPEVTPDAAENLFEQAAGSRQLNVLCIEDNPANLRLVERILAFRKEIRLLSASAPGLGLELARAHRPALILLDINLPGMDGFEVLRRLRAQAETSAIPVIGVSANAMPKDIERAQAAGFVDYLTKPLDVAAFLKAVDAHLARPPESM